ncbi:MAG TPA: hypothetical protein ENF93_01700 [Ignisphaera sp.]|nr:hypothetical protein [Ignisphaera sp.]
MRSALASRLRTYLERVADSIARIGIDVSELKEAIEKISMLEKSFLIVKPFAKGLMDLNDVLTSVSNILSSKNTNTMSSKIKEIAHKIDSLVIQTHKASMFLRLLFISISIVIAFSSYLLTLFPMPSELEVISMVIFALIVLISSAIAVGAMLYLNSIVLLLPLLSTLIAVQILMEMSIIEEGLNMILYIGMGLSLAMLITTMKIVTSSMSSYRKALLTLLSIERIVEQLSSAREKIELKPMLSEELKERFRKVYGHRADDLIRYIEDLSKLK